MAFPALLVCTPQADRVLLAILLTLQSVHARLVRTLDRKGLAQVQLPRRTLHDGAGGLHRTARCVHARRRDLLPKTFSVSGRALGWTSVAARSAYLLSWVPSRCTAWIGTETAWKIQARRNIMQVSNELHVLTSK